MRIWIIHQNALPPFLMGPTRHYDLASKLIAQGHEVYIFASNYCHNNKLYIAEGYATTQKIYYHEKVPFIWFHVPDYRKNSLRRLVNMLSFSAKLLMTNLHSIPKPDVILGSSPSPYAAYAAQRLARRYGVPFVYEIRDLWPATLMDLAKFSKHHPMILSMQKIEDYLLKKATRSFRYYLV